MHWTALNCPQCSAPLPRVALWRAVKCSSCGSLVTRGQSLVQRADFRQALLRADGTAVSGAEVVGCGGARYALLHLLGEGETGTVHLARRLGGHGMLATVKVARDPAAGETLDREAAALRQFHAALDGPAALYASLRLPEVMAHGTCDDGSGRRVLVLRHPSGYWGSLADLHAVFPTGLDPRHLVWIWRRLLDVLHFVHALGWAHGAVRPDHALVHPADHAVRLIGWASARAGSRPEERAADLVHAARTVAVLAGAEGAVDALPAKVPSPLRSLIALAATDADFSLREGATGLDSRLRHAAQEAFGPPTFVPLVLPH